MVSNAAQFQPTAVLEDIMQNLTDAMLGPAEDHQLVSILGNALKNLQSLKGSNQATMLVSYSSSGNERPPPGSASIRSVLESLFSDIATDDSSTHGSDGVTISYSTPQPIFHREFTQIVNISGPSRISSGNRIVAGAGAAVVAVYVCCRTRRWNLPPTRRCLNR